MYDPCEYCPYSSEAMDSVGHKYYQCDLNDDPDLYAGSMCCIHFDDDKIDLEVLL